MLGNDHSGGLGRRVVSAALLLIGIAVAGRVVYELLAPVLPLALSLLALGAVVMALRRWRP